MGFFGFLDGSSNSNTDQSTKNDIKDSRVAVEGEGTGISAKNSNVTINEVADEAYELGIAAVKSTERAQEKLLDTTDDLTRGFLKSISQNSEKTLDRALSFGSDALKIGEKNLDKAFNFSRSNLVTKTDANKSETTQIADKFLKLGIPAIAMVLIVFAFKGR